MPVDITRRLFVIPVNEGAFLALQPEERQTTRLPLLQLALAAIHAHVPALHRHILVVASQADPKTAAYLWEAKQRNYIQDVVLSTTIIEHGTAMDMATHHGISRWHDVFYCQDMDVELLSGDLIQGVEALLNKGEAEFFYDHSTPAMYYGTQVVPPRPLCCMFAGSCAARTRYPVSLEHIQGEITGRDPSPLHLDRMWEMGARHLRRTGSMWEPAPGRREFHTDTGYAFLQLAPLWGLKVKPLPDHIRNCYIHRSYLSPRYGLSDKVVGIVPWDDRRHDLSAQLTIAEHLDAMRTRLWDVYGVEPAEQ